jgi:hypothetical protein
MAAKKRPPCVPSLLLSYPRLGPLARNVARRNRGRRHRLQHGGCICVTGKYERAQFNCHFNEASFEQQRAKAATNPWVRHRVSKRANHSANDWLLVRIDGPQVIPQRPPEPAVLHGRARAMPHPGMNSDVGGAGKPVRPRTRSVHHPQMGARRLAPRGSRPAGSGHAPALSTGRLCRCRSPRCLFPSIRPLPLPVPQPISAIFSWGRAFNNSYRCSRSATEIGRRSRRSSSLRRPSVDPLASSLLN